MNCANHPQSPIAAYCRTCGKPLCTNCTRPVMGVIYCENCLAERVGEVVAQPLDAIGRETIVTTSIGIVVVGRSPEASAEDLLRDADAAMYKAKERGRSRYEFFDDAIRDLGIPVIKTLRVAETLPDTHAAPNAAWLLFDTYDERRAGGTGRRFDWSLLATYERSKLFFLSGGIDPDNVVAAISLVRPDAIDLSSGVESAPGVKDHDKIARLFERVRRE